MNRYFIVLDWENESVMRGFQIGKVRASSIVAARKQASKRFGRKVSVREVA